MTIHSHHNLIVVTIKVRTIQSHDNLIVGTIKVITNQSLANSIVGTIKVMTIQSHDTLIVGTIKAMTIVFLSPDYTSRDYVHSIGFHMTLAFYFLALPLYTRTSSSL